MTPLLEIPADRRPSRKEPKRLEAVGLSWNQATWSLCSATRPIAGAAPGTPEARLYDDLMQFSRERRAQVLPFVLVGLVLAALVVRPPGPEVPTDGPDGATGPSAAWVSMGVASGGASFLPARREGAMMGPWLTAIAPSRSSIPST